MKKILLIAFFGLLSYRTPVGPLPKKEPERAKVSEYETVKVSMYTVDSNQTDESPTVTASGFELDSLNPKRHRVIAVSRDLKRRLKFGQRVTVKGIGRYNGEYVVRDLMHSRWKKKIDILINPGEKAISFKRAKLYIK